MQESKAPFIVIAGNIGSGKSTLTSLLSDKCGWQASFEAVDDNPYLDDFYQDMKRWSFALQVFFLNHRFEKHREAQRREGSGMILDRSIYEDACIFAKGLFEQKLMDTRDFDNYKCLYDSMLSFLSPPDLMIGLKRSDSGLMDRIKLRSRDCEEGIDPNYISQLNHYYNDWFESYNEGPKLIIETEKFDFIKRPQDLQWLADEINQALVKKNDNMMMMH
jgi:deoxyadenosine/deoxycytidine kinase